MTRTWLFLMGLVVGGVLGFGLYATLAASHVEVQEHSPTPREADADPKTRETFVAELPSVSSQPLQPNPDTEPTLSERESEAIRELRRQFEVEQNRSVNQFYLMIDHFRESDDQSALDIVDAMHNSKDDRAQIFIRGYELSRVEEPHELAMSSITDAVVDFRDVAASRFLARNKLDDTVDQLVGAFESSGFPLSFAAAMALHGLGEEVFLTAWVDEAESTIPHTNPFVLKTCLDACRNYQRPELRRVVAALSTSAGNPKIREHAASLLSEFDGSR